MGYKHIDNLYKNQMIFFFKECYALEKVHGTSAHLAFKRTRRLAPPNGLMTDEAWHQANYPDIIDITYFAGGASHEQFVGLFNKEELEAKFRALPFETLTVYGEAYGGKMQGMSKAYGPTLKFIVFELTSGDKWFSVEKAEHFTKELGLEFVPYAKIPATTEAVNAERDKDSEVAIRNGMGPGHIREGVVLRPLFEFVHQGENGGVIRAKHKRDEFKETNTKREVVQDPNYLKVLADADLIAEEWVTPERLRHVIDKIAASKQEIHVAGSIVNSANVVAPEIGLGDIIPAMIEDVEREGKGEIVTGKETRKAISKKTVAVFKAHCMVANKI